MNKRSIATVSLSGALDEKLRQIDVSQNAGHNRAEESGQPSGVTHGM